MAGLLSYTHHALKSLLEFNDCSLKSLDLQSECTKTKKRFKGQNAMEFDLNFLF